MLFLFLPVEGEFILIAVDQADDIPPVLPEDQAADHHRQYGQEYILVDEPGDKRKAGPGPAGAQGHIFRQGCQNQEPAPDHQGDPPVDHDGDGPSGKDALAALEVEHAGEHVAQQAKQARPVLGLSLIHI